MAIENFPEMVHFSCFQVHFFQLEKVKLEEYNKIEEKLPFMHFLLIFCFNLTRNQLPNTFFVEFIFIFDTSNSGDREGLSLYLS